MSFNLTEDELREKFEEEYSNQLDELLGIGQPKPSRISISLIAKRNLPESVAKGPQDDLIKGLMKLTHVRLDRENLTEIDNLESLGPVTNLYLHQNAIECIENLECMTSLQFLTLARNKISQIQNLKVVDTLKLLDLSQNNITDLNPEELPKSLVFLDLRDNPCVKATDYRSRILASLPNLKQLDNVMLTKDEKRAAGHPVSSDDEEEDDDEEEEHDNKTNDDNVDVDDVFRLSADFIRQSRERAAQYTSQHRQHMHQIEEVRSQSQQAMATARSSATPLGSHGDDGTSRYTTSSPASR